MLRTLSSRQRVGSEELSATLSGGACGDDCDDPDGGTVTRTHSGG
eukprot:SAG31_NODE_38401_length_296_cov_1.045685_2_plen_44_part_01